METLIGLSFCCRGVNCTSNITCLRYCFCKVVCLCAVCSILGIIYILLPDEDCIVRLFSRCPFSIKVDIIRQRLIKTILCAFSKRRICVPSGERISVFLHPDRWDYRIFAGFNELRSNISTFILVENDPMSSGGVNREDHTAADFNLSSVRIEFSGFIAVNICAA